MSLTYNIRTVLITVLYIFILSFTSTLQSLITWISLHFCHPAFILLLISVSQLPRQTSYCFFFFVWVGAKQRALEQAPTETWRIWKWSNATWMILKGGIHKTILHLANNLLYPQRHFMLSSCPSFLTSFDLTQILIMLMSIYVILYT